MVRLAGGWVGRKVVSEGNRFGFKLEDSSAVGRNGFGQGHRQQSAGTASAVGKNYRGLEHHHRSSGTTEGRSIISGRQERQ